MKRSDKIDNILLGLIIVCVVISSVMILGEAVNAATSSTVYIGGGTFVDSGDKSLGVIITAEAYLSMIHRIYANEEDIEGLRESLKILEVQFNAPN